MAVQSSRYTFEGTETTETLITRVGGAVDPTAQAQSRKIVTTADAQWLRSFKTQSYVAWNGVTDDDVTVTVYGTINSSVLPNNDEIWLEVVHIAPNHAGTIATTTKSNLLATGASVASDSSVWNGTQYANFEIGPSVPGQLGYSNNNLTVTILVGFGGNYRMSRSTSYQTTGKYYFEITNVNVHGGGSPTGICTSAATESDININLNDTATTISGILLTNGSNTGINIGAATNGDVTCFAIDLTARKAWIRRNAGIWNADASANPVTGVNGLTIKATDAFSPFVCFGGGSQAVGDAFTGNFGLLPYRNAAPAGFGNWPAASGGWKPFKLTTALERSPLALITGNSTTITWDSANATAATLSGGNLVATNTGTTSADQGVRGTAGLNSGKRYFEITLTTLVGAGANMGFGVGTTTSTYTNMGSSATSGALCYITVGNIWANGANTGSTLGALGAGYVIGIAVDLDARKIWFRKILPTLGNWNGVAALTCDPVTGFNGITLASVDAMTPFCTFGGAAGVASNVFTANFGASAFSGAVPFGFASGWPTAAAVPSYLAPAGHIETRVRVAKPSATYYIDPQSELSPTTATVGAVSAYKSSQFSFEGTETTEPLIVRTGGATDPTGQQQSRKIVTTADAQWLRPFKAEPYAIWNQTTGANVTVTVYGTVGGSTLPLSDEIWMDVEYLTLSSAPPTTFDVPVGGVAVTNGGLTVTHNNTTNSVGANSSSFNVAGKYYFEVTVGATSFPSNALGIILPTGTYADVGNFVNSTVVNMAGNASSGYSLGAIGGGDLIGVAVDLDARLAWFRKNGGNWNGSASYDPTTGAGGAGIGPGAFAPCVRFTAAGSADNMTANFGTTAYANAAPSGFGNWLAPPAPLGKIVTTTKANLLATGTSVASDSSTWSNTQYTTFDGAPFATTLTNYNLTATLNAAIGGNFGGARSASAKTSGKYYFEVTVLNTRSNADNIGILSTAGSFNDLSTMTNATVAAPNGSVASQGGTPISAGAGIGSWVAGDVIGCAIDLDNKRAWFRRNAGNWNGNASYNPATNTGGVNTTSLSTAPVIGFGGGAQIVGKSYAANFGMTAYAQTPPAGFGNWPSSGWQPFKLSATLSSPQPGVAGYIEARVRAAKASSTYYFDPKVELS